MLWFLVGFGLCLLCAGELVGTVSRDALIVIRKYGILSRRELFDCKYTALTLQMGTVPVLFSKLVRLLE